MASTHGICAASAVVFALLYMIGIITMFAVGCNPYVSGGCPSYTVMFGSLEVQRSTDLATGATTVLYSSAQTDAKSPCGVINKNCMFEDGAPPPLPNGTTATVLASNVRKATCYVGDLDSSLYHMWLAGVIMVAVPFGVVVIGVMGLAIRTIVDSFH